jgi:hypothetical protein
MLYDHGCHGEVTLGPLPRAVQKDLIAVPGEWLEFEPASSKIVVRHIQPTSGPDLPIIAGELVHMLSQIPPVQHAGIAGGDFFVHTMDTGQFVRLQVEPGGALHIRWAQPDFERASKHPYRGRQETRIDRHFHRLDGSVTLEAPDPARVAEALRHLADTFEGLYPQGHCDTEVDETQGTVRLEMRDLNLDAHLLVETLQKEARPGSLRGHFDLSSFGEALPEEHVRFVFESGKTMVQHPLLWPEESRQPSGDAS